MPFKLDYDRMVFLDAENLAEGGIGQAYQELLPTLRSYVPEPASVEERMDDNAPSYSVSSAGFEYEVFAPSMEEPESDSWGRATFAFFQIVNRQLSHSAYRFYAINGGNDLGGMFLTDAEVAEARRTLREKRDWPYIPRDESPAYGQEC